MAAILFNAEVEGVRYQSEALRMLWKNSPEPLKSMTYEAFKEHCEQVAMEMLAEYILELDVEIRQSAVVAG